MMKYIAIICLCIAIIYGAYLGLFTSVGKKIMSVFGGEEVQTEVCQEHECLVSGKCIPVPTHSICLDPANVISADAKVWECRTGYNDIGEDCMCKSEEYICTSVQADVNTFETNIQALIKQIDTVNKETTDIEVVNTYNKLVDDFNILQKERNIFVNENCICQGGYKFNEIYGL